MGALGCLMRSLLRVSAVSAAIGSSEDNSRIAPFMFLSANLASILFFRISVSGFGLEFFFLKGNGNSSGGKSELRKVEIWFLIFVTSVGLLALGLSFSGFFRQWKEKQYFGPGHGGVRVDSITDELVKSIRCLNSGTPGDVAKN